VDDAISVVEPWTSCKAALPASHQAQLAGHDDISVTNMLGRSGDVGESVCMDFLFRLVPLSSTSGGKTRHALEQRGIVDLL
jgi:hypothetical protein